MRNLLQLAFATNELLERKGTGFTVELSQDATGYSVQAITGQSKCLLESALDEASARLFLQGFNSSSLFH